MYFEPRWPGHVLFGIDQRITRNHGNMSFVFKLLKISRQSVAWNIPIIILSLWTSDYSFLSCLRILVLWKGWNCFATIFSTKTYFCHPEKLIIDLGYPWFSRISLIIMRILFMILTTKFFCFFRSFRWYTVVNPLLLQLNVRMKRCYPSKKRMLAVILKTSTRACVTTFGCSYYQLKSPISWLLQVE